MNASAPTPPRDAPVPPVVFRYLDARRFLADRFEYDKTRIPALSHRYVAKFMGSTSSGFFKDILNGRVRISAARAADFSRLFKLPPAESAYFEALVQYTQAESPEERDRLLTALSAGADDGKSVVEAFQLEYFQKWHYAAVRELLAIDEIRDTAEDAARLARLLDPPLKPTDVRNAFRLLLKLKLIRKNAQGVLQRTESVVRSGGDKDPARIKPAIRGNIELALRALETLPPAKRPFSYLTLSVSEDSFTLIRDKIAAMRREILEIATRDTHADRIYQLNFQMFPLTANEGAEKHGKPAKGDRS